MIRIVCVALGLAFAAVAGAQESATQAVAAYDQLPPPASERTLADWYAMGGWVMHLLVACSVIAVAIGLERAVSLRSGAVAPRRLTKALVKAASSADFALFEEHNRKSSSALASLGGNLLEAWRRTRDRVATEEALEVAASSETARLSRNLSLLSSVGNVATLLGLLGTVLGMIEAFETIASQGSSDAAVVAGGIFRALVTTAAGLSIGIFAFTLHALLRRRVEGWIERLEDDLTEVLDALETVESTELLPAREEALEPQAAAS
ncbi:MAG: MotA/TolQ/ExbB proton channel family protein [Myxococcota bacterium]